MANHRAYDRGRMANDGHCGVTTNRPQSRWFAIGVPTAVGGQSQTLCGNY